MDPLEKLSYQDSSGEKNDSNFTNLVVTALHPKVADAISHLLTEAKARKMSVGMHMGIRTGQKQDELYALGRTVLNPDGQDNILKPMGNIVTNAKAWESYHCYGLAADIVFKDSKGNWTWDMPESEWEELGKTGEIYGLEWGGRWHMKDLPHFQIRPKGLLGLNSMKNLLIDKGIDSIWALV